MAANEELDRAMKNVLKWKKKTFVAESRLLMKVNAIERAMDNLELMSVEQLVERDGSMVTDEQRLDMVANRLSMLFHGERSAKESQPACVNIYNEFMIQVGHEELGKDSGPDVDALLVEMDAAEQDSNGNAITDETEPKDFILPTEAFFYGVGWLAFAKQEDIKDYDAVGSPLLDMVGQKAFRARCCPVFFSWCMLLLEKFAVATYPDPSSPEFIEDADRMLNAVFFYFYERTDVKPSQPIMDNALRIMRSVSKHQAKPPKFWPSYLRIFVTRCLRTRELPFEIQEMCYRLTYQAAWMIGPRFWTADEQFVRTLAAMCAVHWRLMLEGLAMREPIVTAYTLFLEIFLVCEERNRISDQTAICVAGNCKEILESIAGYIKGEDQNPKPLRASERYIVTALASTLVATGAFQMIHEEDEKVIVDWWLKHSVEQSDVFRQLMMCSPHVKQLDPRVMAALAGYYERCVVGDVPEEEADLMVLHWVLKLVQDNRTDFYDRASLSDCVARLERVRTPKKYVDALKKLKC